MLTSFLSEIVISMLLAIIFGQIPKSVGIVVDDGVIVYLNQLLLFSLLLETLFEVGYL